MLALTEYKTQLPGIQPPEQPSWSHRGYTREIFADGSARGLFMPRTRPIRHRKRGVTSLEYAMVSLLVSLSLLLGGQHLSDPLKKTFNRINYALSGASRDVGASR